MSNIVNTSYEHPTRVSYFKGIIPEKIVKDGKEPVYKFGGTLLIPKEDKATIKAIEAAIEYVKKEKWPNKVPPGLKVVFRDGDKNFNDGGVPKTKTAGEEPYGGNMFLASWKNPDKPAIIGPAGTPLKSEDVPKDHIVSGDYCLVKIKFFAWESKENGAGVSADLVSFQLIKKGEPLGNSVDTTEGFKPIEVPDATEGDPDDIMGGGIV